MHILALDGMNLFHRARSGFRIGEHFVVFNFFRQLRSLVEQFKPTRVYLALEGSTKNRKHLLPEYKENRIVDELDTKFADLQSFFRQKDVAVDLLKNFPVTLVRHPHYEADDTIANLVGNSTSVVPWTVVSTDTDFIQLLQKHDNVKLYNPVRKCYVDAPVDYDYVMWKSLRGDSSDNIPGLEGVGDKTAAWVASNPDSLDGFLTQHSATARDEFSRNYELINFAEWTDDERLLMTSSHPQRDWEAVHSVFSNMGFNSIVKDSAWQKFTSTFDSMW